MFLDRRKLEIGLNVGTQRFIKPDDFFFFFGDHVLIVHLLKTCVFDMGATIVINLYCTRPLYFHGFSVNVALFVNCSSISDCSHTLYFCVLSRKSWKDHGEAHFSIWVMN